MESCSDSDWPLRETRPPHLGRINTVPAQLSKPLGPFSYPDTIEQPRYSLRHALQSEVSARCHRWSSVQHESVNSGLN